MAKNLLTNASDTGDASSIPGSGICLGEGNDTPISILAWKIPWTEEPGRLQSMKSQRVGHNIVTKPQQHYHCFASLASTLEQEFPSFPSDVLLQSFIHLTIFIEHLLNIKNCWIYTSMILAFRGKQITVSKQIEVIIKIVTSITKGEGGYN